MGEGPAASSVKEGRKAGNCGYFGAGSIFSEAGGGGRVGGCGKLAWVVGQRYTGPGAASPAMGLCPQHASSTAETQHRQGQICSLLLVTLPAEKCVG